MKLAILFPGIGYHTDKPLLYYSKKILKNMDYEIKEILLIYNRVVDKMKVVYPFYESVIIKKPKKVNV